MTDQPKPMSVEEARMALYNASDKSRHDAEDALIAAVERRERERVLAEFRKFADNMERLDILYSPSWRIRQLIQSLETTNKKP